MRMRIAVGLLLLVLSVAVGVAPAAAQCPRPLHYLAGIEDDFAPPQEATSPSDELVAYTEESWPQVTTRLFDTEGTDMALIHTFTGWTEPPCGATLTLHVHAGPNPLSTNDSIRMQVIGGSDPQQAFLYWVTIRFVTGSWGPGDDAVVTLDLADLPAYGGFPTDILPSLSGGKLDLLVEDDTAVDYAQLDICRCPHPSVTPIDHMTWGRLKSRYGSGGE